jgi:linearmycin/streptolysin S transport system permease protein
VGPAGRAFVERALGDPALRDVVTVDEVGSDAAARALLDGDRVSAVIVLPRGLGGSLAEGRPAGIVVRGRADRSIARGLAQLVVVQYEARARAAALATAGAGADPVGLWPLTVRVTTPGGGRLDAATHYGPAVGLFFVLVTLGFAAAELAGDRARGIVERVAATSAPRGAVLAGRAAAAVAIGGLSLGTLAFAMAAGFGEGWGPPVSVAAVSVAVLAAMTGIAAAVAAFARTPDQAWALAAVVSFACALGSGSFAPPGTASRPAWAALSPTTDALDAYALATTEHAGLAALAPSLAALVAVGAAGVGLAAVRWTRVAP